LLIDKRRDTMDREEMPTPLEWPGEGAGTVENARLCRREVEVARLVALGYTNHEIAEVLLLSHSGVREHLDNLIVKCGGSHG
jgi:DNA-binding NarL/FixJ family response regulator